MLSTEERRREIEAKGRIREFVFGIQDGLISTVGLLAGMQAAGSNRFTILMAGAAAVCSGAFSMSAGAYLSSKSEKEIFDHQLEKEARFVDRNLTWRRKDCWKLCTAKRSEERRVGKE